MKIFNFQQNSPEWDAIRIGKITASDVHKLMGAKGIGKGGESYLLDISCEIETGMADQSPDTYAMQRGREMEAVAAKIYDIRICEPEFLNLESVGFIQHDTLACGVSPDRIIQSIKKGVEFKCHLTQSNHKRYFRESVKTAEPKYYWQCIMGLFVTGYESWDFVSYHPNFAKSGRDLWVETINRADVLQDISLLESRIKDGLQWIKNYDTNEKLDLAMAKSESKTKYVTIDPPTPVLVDPPTPYKNAKQAIQQPIVYEQPF